MQMRLLLLAGMCSLVGCGYTVYNVRIPWTEDRAAVFKDASHVVIDDARPQKERSTHLAKEIWSCERWFGDDTFQPSRLVYLDALIAERVTTRTSVHIRLDRFDIVEYCQHTGNGRGAAAARNSGARGLPAFEPGALMGDSVHLRLTGSVNGVPFDVTRSFDYGHLPYTSPKAPSSNYMYRVLLRDRMGKLADEIVHKLPQT
jgi:hypothetical protein